MLATSINLWGDSVITVLDASVDADQLDQFVRWIEGKGLAAHVSRGSNQTIVGLVGDTSVVDPALIESLDFVNSVQRVSEPFKRAGRSFHPEDTVVDCGLGVRVGAGELTVIAGPANVEGAGFLDIARACKEAGATMLRGSVYARRTSPYDGGVLKADGLEILSQAREELGMPVVSHVRDVRDLDTFASSDVDVLEVGAREAQNVSLLREAGQLGRPVLLRRGAAMTIDELLVSAETIMAAGNERVILCERGIRTFEPRTSNTLDVSAIPVLRRLTHLPVVVDPTRAGGQASLVEPLSLAATAAGASGVEIEVHTDPELSWSPAARLLTPEALASCVRRCQAVRTSLGSA